MAEIRTCKKFDLDTDKLNPDPKSVKFIFDSFVVDDVNYVKIIGLPFELEKDQIYIITSWNSNHYVQATSPNSFILLESYGKALNLTSDYLIINPNY